MTYVLRPDEVRERYGPLFCKGFYTLVDEENGVAQVIERCSGQGPAEWDVMNRRRTKGVATEVSMRSGSIVMDAVIGERDISFGPVQADVGGQGLKALKVEGDEVRTTWYGIAGAGVGIGACIPQCPDVIRTEYPDDFKIGGAHTAHVDIITPKMVRVIIGVDDTDTKEKGASWVTSMRLGTQCPIGKFLEHKIIQLNPKAPNKTTNCCSTAVSFAVKEEDIPALVEFATEFVRKETYSDDTVITVFKGLRVPESLREFGWSCKSVLYTQEDAVRAAEENGVQIISVTGMKGVIGAVAAIGCFDLGEAAAGIPEDVRAERSMELPRMISDPVYAAYAARVEKQVREREIPRHIAVIMDGNRRYAKEVLGTDDINQGHELGKEKLREFLDWCIGLGVKYLTVYAFSTENFKREESEVDFLMDILEKALREFADDPRISKHRVAIRVIGDCDLLPQNVIDAMEYAYEKTKGYDDYCLNLAIAYGGRQDIVEAVRRIAADVKDGSIAVDDIDESVFGRYISTFGIPDPDLVMRTSGEIRVSNFLLWQLAYSELYFTDVYWPGFRYIDLLRAIRTFQQRKRRYGTRACART